MTSMRIKIDECLPHDLKGPLAALGHDVDSVLDEQLSGSPDRTVCEAAISEGRVVLTKDVGLVDARYRPPGAHPGLVLVRMHEADRAQIFARVMQAFTLESVEAWRGAIVVIAENKVRVRHPGV